MFLYVAIFDLAAHAGTIVGIDRPGALSFKDERPNPAPPHVHRSRIGIFDVRSMRRAGTICGYGL